MRQAALTRNKDEAPLASAISAAVAIKLGPICNMRSSGSRDIGPAIVTTPSTLPACVRTGADIALMPGAKTSTITLKPRVRAFPI